MKIDGVAPRQCVEDVSFMGVWMSLYPDHDEPGAVLVTGWVVNFALFDLKVR